MLNRTETLLQSPACSSGGGHSPPLAQQFLLCLLTWDSFLLKVTAFSPFCSLIRDTRRRSSGCVTSLNIPHRRCLRSEVLWVSDTLSFGILKQDRDGAKSKNEICLFHMHRRHVICRFLHTRFLTMFFDYDLSHDARCGTVHLCHVTLKEFHALEYFGFFKLEVFCLYFQYSVPTKFILRRNEDWFLWHMRHNPSVLVFSEES